MIIALALLIFMFATALALPRLTARILATFGFVAFGMVGVLEGTATLRGVAADIQHLWLYGDGGKIYYGVHFEDDE